MISGIICITKGYKKYKKIHPQNNVAIIFIFPQNIYI